MTSGPEPVLLLTHTRMRSIKSTGISNEKFAPWLRRELARACKLGLVLLAAGGAVIWGLTAASPAFEAGWTNFNYRLSGVALDQHPLALARTFASRLRESEYGWKPFSLGTPFNVTAAREDLRRVYPEVTGVFDGVPQIPRGSRLRAANATLYEQRVAAYLQRYREIESGRFSSLYDRDDLFSAPNANVKLGLFVTKFFGLVDAVIFTAGTIVGGGLPGILLFGTVLALSAGPLWRSRRPARTILKVAQEIVKQQDAFFTYGVRHLRPLNLKTVADAISMHESTVSRVTANKYMATNRGLFELKYFFTSAIAATSDGDAHSSEAVRDRIRAMIDAEPACDVLSDDKIVERLRSDGIDIARRTVAKYREALRIPSSVQRRRLKRIADRASL